MYTLTLIAQKGGTGKTALAINLAVAAEALDLRRALVDLDLREHHCPRCTCEERWGAPADLAPRDYPPPCVDRHFPGDVLPDGFRRPRSTTGGSKTRL